MIVSDWLREFPTGACTGSEQKEQKSERERMAAASEEKWKEAFEAVKAQFELTVLLPEQQEVIKAFFKGKMCL